MSKQDSHLNCVSITKSEYNDSQFEDLSNKNTFDDTCTISNNELTENKTPFLLPNEINNSIYIQILNYYNSRKNKLK